MRLQVIVLILALAFFVCLAGAQVTVCPDCPLRSISAGLHAAGSGDTIWVEPGTYPEPTIIVNKPVTIIGRDWPVIDAHTNEGKEAITVIADSVTITGLVVKNVSTSYLEDRAGIRIRKSKHFRLEGNRLENTFFGIYLEHASDGIISGNQVVGQAVNEMSSGNAVHLWYCKNIAIIDNVLSRHRDGIYLEFVDNSVVSGNVSHDHLRYGLHFMFSNDDEYFENTFERNGAGVAVMFSKNINMYRNRFRHNWGKASYGLLLKEIYDAEIRNNQFERNSIAIYVEGSTRIKYKQNLFKRNGWAIKISGGCLDNIIQENNFVHNTFDLSINTVAEGQLVDHNYWSGYSGYDLDRDGVGDIPYRPVKLFNYIVNRTPEAIVLLRSLFIDIVNFSERISPVLTPDNLIDSSPYMTMLDLDFDEPLKDTKGNK